MRQTVKLQAEVLGPLHAWSVGYSAAQKKVDAMRRHALELDSRRRTVIELNAQVYGCPGNPHSARLPRFAADQQQSLHRKVLLAKAAGAMLTYAAAEASGHVTHQAYLQYVPLCCCS